MRMMQLPAAMCRAVCARECAWSICRSASTHGHAHIAPQRIRVITMDVTGTIIRFNGRLGQWYRQAAKRCGVKPPDPDKIEAAFPEAYEQATQQYPLFGGKDMHSKDWWRHCVLDSLKRAGCEMTDEDQEAVFQRIYGVFGSTLTYSAFDDAVPFLRWARRHGVVTGVVSNADERYGDSILPMLGIDEHIDFFCFSKDVLVQKPDVEMFKMAIKRSHLPDLTPAEVLHIGNHFQKDFQGAREAGMHSVLLSRFQEDEAQKWTEKGGHVMKDLLDVVEWLGRNNIQLGSAPL